MIWYNKILEMDQVRQSYYDKIIKIGGNKVSKRDL